MIQAGLHKITLYENRNLSINYDAYSITTDGQIIDLENFAKLEIEPGLIVVDYKISAQIDDLEPAILSAITNSGYGWVAKFDFLSNETKIIEKPFFRPEYSQLNNNISRSRELDLTSWNKQGLINFS